MKLLKILVNKQVHQILCFLILKYFNVVIELKKMEYQSQIEKFKNDIYRSKNRGT